VHVLQRWATRKGIEPSRTRVAVQGFGNAGYHFARLARAAGYRIVALSDSKGGIHSADGLDPDLIMRHKRSRRELKAMLYCDATVCEESEHDKISNADLLELEVDVLALAALENQVTANNAERVNAGCVLEIANGPVDSQADAILSRRGVPVLPDVLVNAGGVTVSYFEWVQNRAGLYWEEAEVNDRLQKRLDAKADEVFGLAERDDLSLRTAAYVHGVGRIVGGITEKGTQAYFQNSDAGGAA
jgi:glutamate dehydrogenase (NADP+)